MWFEDDSQYTHDPSSMISPDWPVIPLSNRGKPIVQYGGGKWGEDRFRPRTAPELLERPLFALCMAGTGLMCLDIDRHQSDGVATLADWREEFHVGMPPTLATRSKSGTGYHLFYLKPETVRRDVIGLRIREGESGASGLDVRATGLVSFCTRDGQGMIATPHNGLPVAPCPRWLELVLTAKSRPEYIPAPFIGELRGCPGKCGQAIAEGQRNDTLFRWGLGLSNSYDNWAEHVTHRGRASHLPEPEIRRIITSIAGYASRHPSPKVLRN